MSEVHDNSARSRYELAADGHTAIAVYRREGDVLAFTHTEVPEALEGKGIGTRLIAGALADVRAKGLTIRPLCAFVAAYVDRHPETRDLLAE
ncbi:GNAT family N-acetyltransferase [Sphingomonas bacterium]|uniref:GNAT family N-acetyltransferase n=1 Tax=Sphingomonas bacterium TaxID=1895847 RepID=UPI001575C021|nr:GNAT family N-acetyltransferase [Sphingomonas bacterium]